MESLVVYIPMDRRQALARGESSPIKVRGTSLFADISGFTPLTEALARALGPQRGAEELTHHLNRVYDTLIAQVHVYGGSVIGFSGDAITCWFDNDDGKLATTSALAMQEKMKSLAEITIPGGERVTLGMKAAVTFGNGRRYNVGEPKIRVIDVITGEMIDTLATAEHQAYKGEVVIDQATANELGNNVIIDTWRLDPESGEKFAVIDRLALEATPCPWPDIPSDLLHEDWIHPWLHEPVYVRLQRKQGEFLAELRPAVALFLRFQGIDYDGDKRAQKKLDEFVQRVQSTLARYDGTLIQLTIGDKGSYLYAAFGAPIAHEDNADRATSAALDMRQTAGELSFISSVQIGISQGRMRTGAYGSATRRTYGVLGDAVNQAARLMQAAEPGQILIDQKVYNETSDSYKIEDQATLKLKGKTGKVTVYSLKERKKSPSIGWHQPKQALPLVGRSKELSIVTEKIELVKQNSGQMLGFVAEAGIGKSRLMSESIRLAEENGIRGYGGECQSYGMNTSYLVWQSVWQNFFEIDQTRMQEETIQTVKAKLTQLNPRLVSRLPLLSSVLNISIPDNDLTQAFDAKLRKSSLEALLVDCLREGAKSTPVLIALENCQWIDPLSYDLIDSLARSIPDQQVLILMAYRPSDNPRLAEPRLTNLAHYTEIPITSFSSEESHTLIRLKIEQFYGEQTDVSPALVDAITNRAEGNPFYIEELLSYFHDHNIDLTDEQEIKQLELPGSLHRLILTRIDQRTESQKVTLKVASVIGRQFVASWLWDGFRQLDDEARIKEDLEILRELDITPVDTLQPELRYLFKQLVTQEVAYESLPFSTRAQLHDQLGQFIEKYVCDYLDQCVYLLAHHYERSDNEEKKREYLLKAGEVAQASYANQAAIEYYEKVLDLLPPDEQTDVLLKLGQVLGLVGEWQSADERFDQAMQLAGELQNTQCLAWSKTEKAELSAKQGNYDDAEKWLLEARSDFESVDDEAGVGQVLHVAGTVYAQQAKFDQSQESYKESLDIRRKLDDQGNIANILNNVGIIARMEGNTERSIALYEESLEIRRELGDKCAIAVSLNNLGNVALQQGDHATARSHLEEAVNLQREVGDRFYIANALNNLGNVARAQGDYQQARDLYNESLLINQELGAQWAVAYLLEDIGCLAAMQNQPERALKLAGAASVLRDTIGSRLSESEQSKLDEILAGGREALTDSEQTAAWEDGEKMLTEDAIQLALLD